MFRLAKGSASCSFPSHRYLHTWKRYDTTSRRIEFVSRTNGFKGNNTCIIFRNNNINNTDWMSKCYNRNFSLCRILKEEEGKRRQGSTDPSVASHSYMKWLVMLGIVACTPVGFLWWLEPTSGGLIEGDEPNAAKQFQDPGVYKNRSTGELYRSLIIFKLCEYDGLLQLGLRAASVRQKQ